MPEREQQVPAPPHEVQPRGAPEALPLRVLREPRELTNESVRSAQQLPLKSRAARWAPQVPEQQAQQLCEQPASAAELSELQRQLWELQLAQCAQLASSAQQALGSAMPQWAPRSGPGRSVLQRRASSVASASAVRLHGEYLAAVRACAPTVLAKVVRVQKRADLPARQPQRLHPTGQTVLRADPYSHFKITHTAEQTLTVRRVNAGIAPHEFPVFWR